MGTVPQRTSGGRCARNGWPAAGPCRSSAAHGNRHRPPGQDRERQAPADREHRRKACDASSRAPGMVPRVLRGIPSLVGGPRLLQIWPEYEDKAASLRDWSPSIVTGLLQTEDYARALISVSAGAHPGDRQPPGWPAGCSASSVSWSATTRRRPGSWSTNCRCTGGSDRPRSWPPSSAASSRSPRCRRSRPGTARGRPPRQRQRLPDGRQRRLDRARRRRLHLHRGRNRFSPRRALRYPQGEKATGRRIGGADREAGRNMGGWRKSTYSDANGGNCVEVASAPAPSWSATPPTATA